MLLCYVISCYHKEFSSMKCHSQWIKGISLWRHCGAASVGGCSRVQPCIRQSERRKADARNISFQTLYDGQFTLSTYLIIPYYPVIYNVHQEVWIVLKNFLYERTSHHAKLCFDRTYWLCYEANTISYDILNTKTQGVTKIGYGSKLTSWLVDQEFRVKHLIKHKNLRPR